MTPLQKEACRAIVNIFETGKVRGDYGAVTVIRGDNGHLSYGRSQVSLGSGNLYRLLDQYCAAPDARFANDLKSFLPRFQARDLTLDTDAAVKALLVRAGKEDPVMRGAQDLYFNRNYFAPACTAAESSGLTLPLAYSVAYDGHVQGGWSRLAGRLGKVNDRGEQDWLNQYIQLRRDWLSAQKPPVPTTVYRMDSFKALAADGNWDLRLPFRVHGVTVTEEALLGDDAERLLRLTTPYLRGDDVKALQTALNVAPDGVYGPYTDALVKQYQKSKGITEEGVGPLTRKSLNLG